MFKDNTLFIVGAGASAEFNLPVGRGLSEIIRESSDFRSELGARPIGDPYIRRLIQNRYPDGAVRNEVWDSMRHIRDHIFMANSIDNFIDMHSHLPKIAEIGKLQIAIAISRAESRSLMSVDVGRADPKLSLPALKDTWIDSFARILFDKVKHDDVENLGDNITIICFNYDRCIEFYLIEAIRQTYVEVDYQIAREIVSRINIIHPYGFLGELPPSIRDRTNDTTPFGFDIEDGFDPWPVSERLKTYTEQVEDKGVLDRMNAAVAQADQVVFLGFGFLAQNMQLLTSEDNRPKYKHVFSTGKGISQQEFLEVSQRILRLWMRDLTQAGLDFVKLEIGTSCAELFNYHGRNLSAA